MNTTNDNLSEPHASSMKEWLWGLFVVLVKALKFWVFRMQKEKVVAIQNQSLKIANANPGWNQALFHCEFWSRCHCNFTKSEAHPCCAFLTHNLVYTSQSGLVKSSPTAVSSRGASCLSVIVKQNNPATRIPKSLLTLVIGLKTNLVITNPCVSYISTLVQFLGLKVTFLGIPGHSLRSNSISMLFLLISFWSWRSGSIFD